jgi:hypothetical protein
MDRPSPRPLIEGLALCIATRCKTRKTGKKPAISRSSRLLEKLVSCHREELPARYRRESIGVRADRYLARMPVASRRSAVSKYSRASGKRQEENLRELSMVL